MKRVGVRASKGWLELVYRYGVDPKNPNHLKRRYLSLGLPDTVANRQIAESKGIQLKQAIDAGIHDEWIAKFKALKRPQAESVQEDQRTLDLKTLWDKFVEYKSRQVAVTTLESDYLRFGKTIEQLPTVCLEQANAIREWLILNKKPDSVKRHLTYYAACCEWATDANVLYLSLS